MKGRTVAVLRPKTRFVDGDAVKEWTRETVGNVLAAPAATSAQGEEGRPDGTVAALALAFPRTYAESLRGCEVELDGRRYAVVGDPIACDACPTPWNRTAEAVRADG